MKAAVHSPCLQAGNRPSLSLPPVVHIDFVSHATRRIPVSRSAHIRGYEPIGSGKPAVAFESMLERDIIRALAKYAELRTLRSQPLTIYYQCNGQACRYTPDLLVELSSVPPELETLGFSQQTLIEVKPAAMLALERERLERHGRAVRGACREPWILLTDEDLARGALEVSNDRR